MDGKVVLQQIKRVDRYVPVIMITAYDGYEDCVALIKSGAFHYLPKPIGIKEVVPVIKRALQAPNLNGHFKHSTVERVDNKDMQELDGESPQIRKVLEKVQEIAPTDWTVLIQGETGTGKELASLYTRCPDSHQGQPHLKSRIHHFRWNSKETEA